MLKYAGRIPELLKKDNLVRRRKHLRKKIRYKGETVATRTVLKSDHPKVSEIN